MRFWASNSKWADQRNWVKLTLDITRFLPLNECSFRVNHYHINLRHVTWFFPKNETHFEWHVVHRSNIGGHLSPFLVVYHLILSLVNCTCLVWDNWVFEFLEVQLFFGDFSDNSLKCQVEIALKIQIQDFEMAWFLVLWCCHRNWIQILYAKCNQYFTNLLKTTSS